MRPTLIKQHSRITSEVKTNTQTGGMIHPLIAKYKATPHGIGDALGWPLSF